MTSRLISFLFLLLISTCDGWLSTQRTPLPKGAFTCTPRTPRFVDYGPIQPKRSPLAGPSKIALPHRKRWIRSLACVASLFLVTTLMSPQAAMASTVAEAPVCMPLALPQRLPTPVPRIVELQLTVRLLFASLLGAAVGQERSSTHKHSAGVRTMALVALGACTFTICSSFGFTAISGGKCDPSRMASNVASGVGFVGAGVITTTSDNTDSRQSIVHGLTTATAIWISAAIGVSCGVGMLYIASAATLSTITILRFRRVKKKVRKLGFFGKQSMQRGANGQNGDFYSADPRPLEPSPQHTKILSPFLSSRKVALEEMNEDEGEWDSHIESPENEDEEDDDEGEQHIVSQTQHNGNNNDGTSPELDERLLVVDRDVTEFRISGQAQLLEQAAVASRGKNLTELVTDQSKYPSHDRNRSSNSTEDCLRRMEPRTTHYSSRSNETLAP